MNKLEQLESKLHQLRAEAKARDRSLGASNRMLFDNTLFRSQSRILSPYVEETLTLYHIIFGHLLETCPPMNNESLALTPLKEITPEKATHLTEKLLDQINAISIELSSTRTSAQVKHESDIQALRQQLEQHKEWESRLQRLVLEKQRIVLESGDISVKIERNENSSNESDKLTALTTLEAAQQRLIRCQTATFNIERQLKALVLNDE